MKIHTSKTGRVSYTPEFLRGQPTIKTRLKSIIDLVKEGFFNKPGMVDIEIVRGDLGRDKPTDFKKLRNRVFLAAGVLYFALCLHGVYCEIMIGRV